MKRALIASILGVAASVASSYGQGTIIFGTYISSAVQSPITWAASGHSGAVTAADGFTATLYYGLGSGLGFSQLSPIAGSGTLVGQLLAGCITGGPIVTMPNWTSGPVTFGISVVNAAGTYGTANLIGGTVATWTEPASSIAGAGLPSGYFTASLISTALPTINVVALPEPGTMAFAGLGAAALLALRRRQ